MNNTLTIEEARKLERGFDSYLSNNNNDIFKFGNVLTRYYKSGKLYISSNSDGYSIYGKTKKETLEIQYLKNQNIRVNIIDNKYNYSKELIYCVDQDNNLQITAFEKQSIIDFNKHYRIGEISRNGSAIFNKNKNLVKESVSEIWREFNHDNRLNVSYSNYDRNVTISNINNQIFIKEDNIYYPFEPKQNKKQYFISPSNGEKNFNALWKRVNKQTYDEISILNNLIENNNKIKRK